MPLSRASMADSTRGVPTPVQPPLRVPEARVLAALVPPDPAHPRFLWPLLTRAVLVQYAGFTPRSGVINQVLHGVGRVTRDRPRTYPGLLARGLLEIVEVDVDGLREANYRVTLAGVSAYQQYVTAHGVPGQKRDIRTCTNKRYMKEVIDAGVKE